MTQGNHRNRVSSSSGGGLANRSALSVGRRAIFCLLVVFISLAGGCADEESGPPQPEPEIGTEVGDRSPALTGVLADGSSFTLDDRSSQSTVLIFYRSAQCGLCRLQLEQLQQHLPAYEYQGARVVGVTLDPPEMSKILLDEFPVGFDLVSVSGDVFEAWQVTRSGAEAPLPATFIVDGDGIVQYRHIGRNAADRSSDAGLLTVLQTLTE